MTSAKRTTLEAIFRLSVLVAGWSMLLVTIVKSFKPSPDYAHLTFNLVAAFYLVGVWDKKL